MNVHLGDLAHVRASLHGPDLSLAVIAWGEAEYARLVNELTVARLLAFLGHQTPAAVVRHDLPRLHSLIFVLSGVMQEPASLLRIDPAGQLLSSRLLLLEIDKEPELL